MSVARHKKTDYETALDFLKTLGILTMIIVHCRFFYSFGYQFLDVSGDKIIRNFFALTGLFSLVLPCLAGSELFFRLRPHLIAGRLKKQSMRLIFPLLVFVAMLDPFKAWFSEGFVYFPRWDVLPMICATIAIMIYFLEKFRIQWLTLLLMVVLILPQLFKGHLQSLVVSTPEEMMKLHTIWYNPIVLILFLFCLWILVVKWTSSFIRRAKQANLLAMILFLPLMGMTYYYWQRSPSFVAAIWNLPIGALISLDPVGGHIWPLLPWSSMVIFGFLVQWFICYKPYPKWNTAAYFVVISLFILFLTTFFDSYTKGVHWRTGYQSQIFSINPIGIIGILAFYATICVMSLNYIVPYLSGRVRALLQFFSSGILILYLVHFILAARLAPIFFKRIGGQEGYFYFVFFVYFASIMAALLLILLYRAKTTFLIRKVK